MARASQPISTKYIYDNQHKNALERLRALEEIEDSTSVECLTTIGVQLGWACLEVGAGAGSIAAWLAQRVGRSGRVLATDLETSLLDRSTYEILRHDIRRDAFPPDTFDLAHMRHTLVHVPQTEHLTVLCKLRRTLKPGGVLLIEESDFSTWQPMANIPSALGDAYARGVREVLSMYARRDMDIVLGQNLPSLVERAGFTPKDLSTRIREVAGRSSEARFHRLSFEQLREAPDADSLDIGAMEEFLACFDDPELRYHTRSTVSVVATRPE